MVPLLWRTGNVVKEHYYSLRLCSRAWPSSQPMNALRAGHGACASFWPVITDQADAGNIFSGAGKCISCLLNHGNLKDEVSKLFL